MSQLLDGNDKKRVKDLEDSSHPLAQGITQAILGVNELKQGMVAVNENLSLMSSTMVKIQKVLTGDPEYHEEGLIIQQKLAKDRHFEVLRKLDALENNRIKDLENRIDMQRESAEMWRTEKGESIDKIDIIEKDVATIKTTFKIWIGVGSTLLAIIEIALKIFGK